MSNKLICQQQVPSEPPSVFPDCAPSMCRQTVHAPDRKIDSRMLSLSQRASLPDELDMFHQLDCIKDWDSFCEMVPTK